jgi:hypothetical protein
VAGSGPGHEWRHGWIPLTPAAALVKAKGSKTTAAKLRAKHGVKGPLTRDVVRASRQQSIDHAAPDRPKTHADLLAEADAKRTKPLSTTLKAQQEIRGLSDEKLAVAIEKLPASNSLRQVAIEERARRAAEADRFAKGRQQSSRAQQLRDQAAAERAKLQGIADGAGVGRLGITDPQANRLSGRGLAQAHRNTDSSLRRYTETQQRANALESQAHLAEARAKEAARTRLTRADVEGATHIVDQHGQPREVVRVNAKTVTVKTPYSWTETVPIEKIRRAIKATPEQIAEAKRRAALRK